MSLSGRSFPGHRSAGRRVPRWFGGLLLGLLATAPAVSSAQGKFVEEEEQEINLVGQKAPAFSLTTLDGKPVSLASLKGKVVLLDFWASWCGPCRKSMPHMEQTWQKYQAKGLVIIGVNVDKEPEKAKAFLAKLAQNVTPSYPLAMDPTAKVLGAYQVMSMPTAFLIGKDGVVLQKFVGFSDRIAGDLEAELVKVLK